MIGEPGRYTRPLATTAAFLDDLDAATPPVPVGERCLAALGPEDARARPRPHGRRAPLPRRCPSTRAGPARSWGRARCSRPSRPSYLGTDADAARAAARNHLQIYLGLPNYTNNWMRSGFTEDDLLDGGSDRLCDALVAWGDEATIARRVHEHHDAGADHVCIQVVTAPDETATMPMDTWRALAPALTST